MPVLAGLAASGLTLLLGALGLFQLALAAGAPLGRFAWGGAHPVLPSALRIGSLVSIAIYAMIALVMLDRAGLVTWLPAGLSGILAWVVVAFFGLGTVMNLASRSLPERLTMSPMAALLCGLSIVVALA